MLLFNQIYNQYFFDYLRTKEQLGYLVKLQISVFGNDYYISENTDIKSLLIWIDVQGFEAKVLLGAKKTLSLKPALAFEFWPYGLKRAGGINGLCDLLIEYKTWNNLFLDNPDPQTINELEKLYIKYQNDDQFSIDRSLNSDRFWKLMDCQPPAWPELVESMHSYR